MLQHTNKQQGENLGPQMQRAVASLALEGITLSPESIEDLKLAEAGKMTEQDVLNRLLARLKV